MKTLKKTQYIKTDGTIGEGLSKAQHAREVRRLRKKGYSFKKIKEITGVKSY